MTSHCPTCNKPKAGRAGSITSYFFQHNFCRCDFADQSGLVSNKKLSSINIETCSNCGKVQPDNKRAGSFTAFLFKELRCTCGGQAISKAKFQGKVQAKVQADTRLNRHTAERKQFTANLRKTNFSNQAQALSLLSIGDNVAGFTIKSVIGQGGMGAVYLVQHEGLQRSFALKALLPSLVNEQNWQRFKAEAKTVAALTHPTFVKVYDLGIHENVLPFYTMDFVAGKTLEDYLIENGALSFEQALPIFSQILDGLAYAHRNGIVHRDIKPANIMLGSGGNLNAVKILDFGIAKLLDSTSTNQGLTMAGEVFGSPYYMSPEQSEGKLVDARSDIYSLGCTLFEVLTQDVPFDADSSIEIFTMHQVNKPPRLAGVSKLVQFSDALECVVAKCLAKQPQDRYQSAKELALDLNRIGEGKDLSEYSHLSKQFLALDQERGVARAQSQFYRENEALDGDRSLRDSSALKFVLAFVVFASIAVIAGVYLVNASNEAGLDLRKRIDSAKKTQAAFSTVSAEGPLVTGLSSNLPEEDPSSKPVDAATSKQIETFLKTNTSPYIVKAQSGGITMKKCHFPDKFSIGRLQVSEENLPVRLIDAQARFPLSANTRIALSIDKTIAQYPQLLKFFKATDLYGVEVFNMFDEDLLLVNLQHLTDLFSLGFKNIQLSNAAVPRLEKFEKLRVLDLGYSSINGAVLARSKILPRLQNLTIDQMDDFRPVLAVLLQQKTIRKLALTSKVNALDINQIAELKELRALSLRDISLSVENCRSLSKLKQLLVLHLPRCSISVEMLRDLSKLESIEDLSFAGCSGSNAEIIAALKRFKKLKVLACPGFELSDQLHQAFPNIEFID